MSLRLRLGATLALLVIPFGVALSFLQIRWEKRHLERRIAEVAIARMEAAGRARCEAAPERFPRRAERGGRGRRRGAGRRGRGRGRPAQIFAYDAALRSENPSAPAPPEELATRIRAGARVASRQVRGRRGPRVEALVRMPWEEGPCAMVLIRRPSLPPPSPLRRVWPSILIALGAVGIAMVVVGPTVRRIRRLTRGVREADGVGQSVIEVGGSDEIAELAETFEKNRRTIAAQIEELERRERALRDYIANTTHDVMLPLTVLQGDLTAAQREIAEGRPVSPSSIDRAVEEAHYLGAMLHNLNAAARLEMGPTEESFSEVELGELVARVASRHRHVAEQRGVELNHAIPEESVTTRGDLTLLEQAVSNLVHNAVRYNRRGGHVALTLDVDRGAGRFVLRVRDDGPGIPEAQLARITERGYRGEAARSRSSQAGGLGLGLHIVRDVVDRHHFSFSISSGPEGGLSAAIEGEVTATRPPRPAPR